MPAAAPGPQDARAEVSWKPIGASALAALASEELSAPEAKAEPRPSVTARSLMEGLPDGGGVDPTGAIPLQIKALEETGEQPARSSVARGAEKLRKKRSSTRALVAVIVVLLLALGVGAGWVFKDQLLGTKPPPRVAQALPADKPTPAAEPATSPKAAEPAPASTASAATATGSAATGTTATGTTAPPAQPSAEPKAAEPKPAEPVKAVEVKEPAPKPVVAAKEPERKREPAKTARERAAEKRQLPAKVARAEPAAPAPAPEPAKPKAARKGGDVLDFDNSNDAALDEALGKGSSGRSVYVPPAPGGGDALPERVTDSQVNETIMTRVSALQGCLTDKGGGGGGGGVLKMRWSIAPDGGVQNLKCITPESASTPFAACVTGVLKGLRFPKTQQGRQDVTFPFKF
jgi:cytoskeletal protein RodZ